MFIAILIATSSSHFMHIVFYWTHFFVCHTFNNQCVDNQTHFSPFGKFISLSLYPTLNHSTHLINWHRHKELHYHHCIVWICTKCHNTQCILWHFVWLLCIYQIINLIRLCICLLSLSLYFDSVYLSNSVTNWMVSCNFLFNFISRSCECVRMCVGRSHLKISLKTSFKSKFHAECNILFANYFESHKFIENLLGKLNNSNSIVCRQRKNFSSENCVLNARVDKRKNQQKQRRKWKTGGVPLENCIERRH